MKRGIYTLANDAVYDHVIALLNSIEVFCGKDMPVCIIPFDENISKLKKAIQERKQIFMLEDERTLIQFEKKGREIWKYKEEITGSKLAIGYGLGVYRRFIAFKGLFDKFVYLDADIILQDNLKKIFDLLSKENFVVYDFSFKKPNLAFDMESKKLYKIIDRKLVDKYTFNSGFFASKKRRIGFRGKFSRIKKRLRIYQS
jgi:lipopolysaccharide biosynthesis glycosyltransferase